MTHFFISYSHKDVYELKALLAFLSNASFRDDEIWFDKNIEAGERWSEEIDRALEEAYAILVLVTPISMSSIYVNYEWSWAIGYGKPVIPLLFKNVPEHLQHPMLRFQYFDCVNTIPDALSEKLFELRNIPTLTKQVDFDISNLIMRFRVLARVTLWAYQHSILNITGEAPYHELLEATLNEARLLFMEQLPQFWYRNSFAFTRKQKRLFENLRARTIDYERELGELGFETQFLYPNKNYLPLLKKVQDFRIHIWEPLVVSLVDREDYKYFDLYLNRLSEGQFEFTSSEWIHFGPMVEMTIKNLSDDQQTQVKTIISDLKNNLSHSGQ